MSFLAPDRAVSGTADGASVAGGESAHGAEEPLRLLRLRSLGRQIVGRLGILNGILFEKLREVLAKSEKKEKKKWMKLLKKH